MREGTEAAAAAASGPPAVVTRRSSYVAAPSRRSSLAANAANAANASRSGSRRRLSAPCRRDSIEALRVEIAQLRAAADQELSERQNDIQILRTYQEGIEEKQRRIEREVQERREQERLQREAEEREREAERRRQQFAPVVGLLQRRPSLNSISSWGALQQLDDSDNSNSDGGDERRAKKGQRKPDQTKQRARLARRRPSLQAWGALGGDDDVRSTSNTVQGDFRQAIHGNKRGSDGGAILRRHSSASLAAMALVISSDEDEGEVFGSRGPPITIALNDADEDRQNANCQNNDHKPTSTANSTGKRAQRRPSLGRQLLGLDDGEKKGRMKRRPSIGSLIGWATENHENDAESRHGDLLLQNERPISRRGSSPGFGSRRGSMGSTSGLSLGLSSGGAAFSDDDNDGIIIISLNDNDSASHGPTARRPSMPFSRASSMRSVASNRDMEVFTHSLQKQKSERRFDRRPSETDLQILQTNLSRGLSSSSESSQAARSIGPFRAFGGVTDDVVGVDGDDSCNRSLGALASDVAGHRERYGRMKRRNSFGALGLLGHAKAVWSKEQADQMVQQSAKEQEEQDTKEKIERRINHLSDALKENEKQQAELKQTQKGQEERIALLRLQIRAAKTKVTKNSNVDPSRRLSSADSPRRQSLDGTAVDVEASDTFSQLEASEKRIGTAEMKWTSMSQQLEEADANVDSFEKIMRRMKRKCFEEPCLPATDEWNVVPELAAIAVTVWDRVVRESEKERTKSKALNRIISQCSYRICEELRKQAEVGVLNSNEKDSNKCNARPEDVKNVMDSTIASLVECAKSLDNDTSRTKTSLALTQKARAIAEKMTMRDAVIFNGAKCVLRHIDSELPLSSKRKKGEDTLSEYLAFRCVQSGTGMSSNLAERKEVLRCQGDSQDLNIKSLERKKDQTESKIASLEETLNEKSIEIIDRKQKYIIGIQELSEMSKPLQLNLMKLALHIKILEYDIAEIDKFISELRSEIQKLKRS